MDLGYQDMAATGNISGDNVGLAGNIRCPIDVTGTAVIGQVDFTNPDTTLANISMVASGNSDFQTGSTISTGNLTFSARASRAPTASWSTAP